jgi:UDP-2,3-diacylglucosamine hydrolase
MTPVEINLPANKKIYFASDFHLGVPSPESSLKREKLIVEWLESIRHDAHSIYLLGDLFDFWFEYKYAIPKGFIRFQGKLAELRDAGIPITIFTGNHDIWMFDYFQKELDLVIHRKPQVIIVNGKKLYLGHGDGLGPGGGFYKFLKKVYESPVCQWLFARIHPNLGISLAQGWSKKSRIANVKNGEEFKGEEKELLLTYCKKVERSEHHDFYLFGHRHLPLELKVSESSRYINLGEWVHFTTYAVFDKDRVELKSFKESR